MALSGNPTSTNMNNKIAKVHGLNINFKNIPTASKSSIKAKLYRKIGDFVQRIRWKAFFFESKNNNYNDNLLSKNSNIESRNALDNVNNESLSQTRNIFPSKKSAPISAKLLKFEDELFNLADNLEFRNVNDKFQDELKTHSKFIKNSKDIFVFADKTNNIYSMKPNIYKKMVKENVTKDYRLADASVIERINNETQDLINDNKIPGKIPKLDQIESFLTIKDHKVDFPAQIKCRLINLSKSHLAKVSKAILDKINKTIREKTGLIQWKNSYEVINWFNGIEGKNKKAFVNFDIVDFYASIKKRHLNDALGFAERYLDIPESNKNIILKACNTILLSDGRVWSKRETEKDGNGPMGIFDIPMGSFHGAEICDLVGLYIMDSLSSIFNYGSFGLYRDDGLGIINADSKTSYSRLCKLLHGKMKNLGFKITLDIGNVTTNFLDVTFVLHNGSFMPYRKPNSEILYVNNYSNHPPHVKKQIPKMLERRLSALSSSKQLFDSAVNKYNCALRNSGYKNQLKFVENSRSSKKKNRRKRDVIYFNPPFCRTIKSNIGRMFLSLVDKHFPRSHVYHSIFNRNTLKISYSCMSNLKSIIQSHNRRVLKEFDNKQGDNKNENVKSCNCRDKAACPLEGKCGTRNVVYKAEVTCGQERRFYIGSTGMSFKERYYGHIRSLRHRNSNSTALSTYCWKVYDKTKIMPDIKWKVLHIADNPTSSRSCRLCDLERMEIAKAKRKLILNKRSELASKCPHHRRMFFK